MYSRHTNKTSENSLWVRWIYIAFICACMMPFLLPNPILKTDLQPYAALLGTLVIAIDGDRIRSLNDCSTTIVITTCTFLLAFYVFCFSGITMTGLRALFNYYSVFVVPYAAILCCSKFDSLSEMWIKRMILVWFSVSSVQFFISRSFATSLVSGGRYGLQYRGVCGLASEPSFFGIACYYFLHLAKRFKSKKSLYYSIIILMGCIYAQSGLGVLFILAYCVIEVFDSQDVRKVLTALLAFMLILSVLWYIISHYLTETRIYDLVSKIIQGNGTSVYDDQSVTIRIESILSAVRSALSNALIPQGFHSRIGSGFGGFLVELGFLALPEIVLIAYAIAITPSKRVLRVLYFPMALLLHFNNTQIGNPILLFIVGMNIYLLSNERLIFSEIGTLHSVQEYKNKSGYSYE